MDEANWKKKKNTIFYAIKNWNKKYLVLYETGIEIYMQSDSSTFIIFVFNLFSYQICKLND